VVTVKLLFLAAAGIALFIGLVYMVLMRYFSGILTWIGIILYFLSLVLLIIFCKNESAA
jgi:ABC-type bacteriocin/lantibiotic exporter with double-glycine peptidase domain